MSNGQKRPRQGSSSLPSKKPFLDVQNQGSAPKPTRKSKGKPERNLKPKASVENGGAKPSTHSKARAGKASNNGTSWLFFFSQALLNFLVASDMEPKGTQDAVVSTRLSDYKSTLIVSAPPQSQARAEKLCMYIKFLPVPRSVILILSHLSR